MFGGMEPQPFVMFRRMEQCFGRYASDIDARATQRDIGFHARDRQSQLGCANACHIAPWATTKDNDVYRVRLISHDGKLSVGRVASDKDASLRAWRQHRVKESVTGSWLGAGPTRILPEADSTSRWFVTRDTLPRPLFERRNAVRSTCIVGRDLNPRVVARTNDARRPERISARGVGVFPGSTLGEQHRGRIFHQFLEPHQE